MATATTPPTPTTAQEMAQERRELAKSLADRGGDPQTVLLRALMKIVLQSLTENRQYLAVVQAEVVRRGGTLPPAPIIRTWEQLVAAAKQMVDAGQGDPVA